MWNLLYILTKTRSSLPFLDQLMDSQLMAKFSSLKQSAPCSSLCFILQVSTKFPAAKTPSLWLFVLSLGGSVSTHASQTFQVESSIPPSLWLKSYGKTWPISMELASKRDTGHLNTPFPTSSPPSLAALWEETCSTRLSVQSTTWKKMQKKARVNSDRNLRCRTLPAQTALSE